MWAQIDDNVILRYMPVKTQFTSGAMVSLDLRMTPMVVEELAKVPVEARRGPLIVPELVFRRGVASSPYDHGHPQRNLEPRHAGCGCHRGAAGGRTDRRSSEAGWSRQQAHDGEVL
jgi:hypothetical protein